jgi:co-chaperonin GroES (HSP10)
MSLKIKKKDFDKVIMVGDRVLIKPKNPTEKTTSGLYLPPSIEKNDRLQQGYVVKVGPGYPIPVVNEAEEPWKDAGDDMKFVPIQPKIGDLAVYLLNSVHEITLNEEKYCIVPNSAIFMLIRDEGLIE